MNDSIFKELKQEAIKIWQTYDNTYGYVDEKINYINSFGNVKDNYGTIIGMFDIQNQRKLYDAVSPDTQMFIDNWVGGLAFREAQARRIGLI